MSSSPFVVFGYGSLIFKPPMHVISRVPGFLKGYVRRFAQMSHDHRGTNENPGRVVTLVHKSDWDAFSDPSRSRQDVLPDEDIVWGVAYTIDPVHASEVREYLDHREKDGYTLETVDVYGLVDGHEKIIIQSAFCYIGRNDNPSFTGMEPLDQLAVRIWLAVGPSGTNKDYLFALAKMIRELAPGSHDSHLFALEAIVRALDTNEG